MNRLLTIIFSATIAAGLYYSCANPKTPTGGPRDTIPPQLVSSYPENKSLNFDDNEITLEFNEFIKVDKIATQLLITPTIEQEYKVKQTGKRVTLQFDDDEPFRENTTYTFNFQNVIKDLTEGNSWQDAKLVFSTGDELDSLFISGNVSELMTGKMAKGASVALYEANDTLSPFSDKPMYFAKTDENGDYILENLVSDTFNIFAFADANDNFKIEPASEPYGFYQDTIRLDSSLSDVNLQLHSLNFNEIRLLSARPIRNYFDFSFNKYIVDYQIVTLEDSVPLLSNFQDNHKKARVYAAAPIDSVLAQITAVDSVDNTLTDTVYIKFEETRLPPEPFSASVEPKNEPVTSDFSAKIRFNKPVLSVNYDSLLFIYDSLQSEPVTPDDTRFNKFRDVLYIDKRLNLPDSIKDPENNAGFTLYVGKGSFISVLQDSSSMVTANYSVLNPVNFGVIKGTVTTDAESFTIQLLNTSFKVIKELRDDKRYTFNHVPPGSYVIRVLVDNNNNGEWDPGNILKNELPEQVVFYESEGEKTITVKANWEVTDINIVVPPYPL